MAPFVSGAVGWQVGGQQALQARRGLHATFMFIPPQTELRYRLVRAFEVDWSRGGLQRVAPEDPEQVDASVTSPVKRWPREISGMLTFSPLDNHSDMIQVEFRPNRDDPEFTLRPGMRHMRLEQLPLPENPANLPATLTNPENDDMAMAAAALFQLIAEDTEFSEEETLKIHRWQSLFHLRQLVYAAHFFHDANKRLPKSQEKRLVYETIDDGDGSARRVALENPNAYSWRVALLPHLGYQELYDQYRFDEPWDSPANSRLIRQMPEVFRHPGDSPESNETRYVGFSGAGALGESLERIMDGTSNTILFVESSTPVIWTKPEDIEFDVADSLQPQLDWFLQNECNVAFCDGSVNTIKTGPGADRQAVRALITASGGEMVDRFDVIERR